MAIFIFFALSLLILTVSTIYLAVVFVHYFKKSKIYLMLADKKAPAVDETPI